MRSSIRHEVPLVDIIGLEWACPCQPPMSFDCWELVRYLRASAGLETPMHVPTPERNESDARLFRRPPPEWVQVIHPVDYCVVRMGPQKNHVGLYRRGRVVHVMKATGVRADDLEVARLTLGPLSFWRHRND